MGLQFKPTAFANARPLDGLVLSQGRAPGHADRNGFWMPWTSAHLRGRLLSAPVLQWRTISSPVSSCISVEASRIADAQTAQVLHVGLYVGILDEAVRRDADNIARPAAPAQV